MGFTTECTNASGSVCQPYEDISTGLFFVFLEDEETLCLKISNTEYIKMVDGPHYFPDYVSCDKGIVAQKPVFFIKDIEIIYTIDKD